MLNICHSLLHYRGLELIPPPTDPIDPPGDFEEEGSIGDIKYYGVVQCKYYVNDATIIFFNPYTGMLRIRVGPPHRGGDRGEYLTTRINNNYYSIAGFEGGFRSWALNGPWYTYFKIDPNLTPPEEAWESNSSVKEADHSKDSYGLRWTWNIIKAPRHDFFQWAYDTGVVQKNGVINLDWDSGTAPVSDYTDDDLILHVRDYGDVQTNNPTIMLDARYVNNILYIINIIPITKKYTNNVDYSPVKRRVG